MSQIFDALQRSEAERAGVGLSALPEATELLRSVERRAVSKSESEAVARDRTTTADAESDLFSGLGVESEMEVPVGAEVAPAANCQDVFSQFQSLHVSLPDENRLVCLSDSGSPAAVAFSLLGVRLGQMRRERPLKKVLITSTIPREGKSTVAANLACTLAQNAQQRTLLLEGDVRRPFLEKMFGLNKNPGICEWLRGDFSLAESIYHLEGSSLWLLPAGTAPADPLELLQSGRLPVLMDHLAAWFDWIIIDSTPALPLPDAIVWARLADGILIVTRQGTTEKRQLQRGIESLGSQKLIGALLNSSKNLPHSDYYYRQPAVSQTNRN